MTERKCGDCDTILEQVGKEETKEDFIFITLEFYLTKSPKTIRNYDLFECSECGLCKLYRRKNND